MLVLMGLFFRATCASRGSASTAAGGGFGLFFGAACTGVGASAAARMGAGQGNTSHADQAGNAQARQEPFQILLVHSPPCFISEQIIEKTNPDFSFYRKVSSFFRLSKPAGGKISGAAEKIVRFCRQPSSGKYMEFRIRGGTNWNTGSGQNKILNYI
jgi:hypothetical protein